jgi:hypothetical protein
MSKYSWLTVTGSSNAAYEACAHLASFNFNAEKHIFLSNGEMLKNPKNSKFYFEIFTRFVND